MKKLFLSAALGAAMIATPALAQGFSGGGHHDQTRAEAKQRADMLFQMLDANHDGTVTRAEAEQAARQFAASRGGGDNGGHEGRIEKLINREFGAAQSLTLAQFEAQALATFDAMDLNHDGVVTVAERQQVREMRQAERGQVPAPQSQPATPAPRTAPSTPQ